MEFLASLEKPGSMGPVAPRGPSARDTGVHTRVHLDGTACLSAAGPLRSFMFPARPWSALDVVAQVYTAKSGQARYLVYLLVRRMALANSLEKTRLRSI